MSLPEEDKQQKRGRTDEKANQGRRMGGIRAQRVCMLGAKRKEGEA